MGNAKYIIATAQETQQQEVYLNYLDLDKVPDELWELRHITHLFLTGNKLKEIPSDILQLSNLQYLDISGNQLTQFPEEILHLEKLNTIDISSNALINLPNNIRDLRNITALDCFGNKLTSLPESIGDCINLTSLRAGNNEIDCLPQSIGKLTFLDTLDLSFNEIEELPSSIYALHRLAELDLSGNRIDLAFSDFEKYQFSPNVLLNKIRQLQHKNSHKKLDLYRQQKEKSTTAAYIETLDKQLKRFPIQNNHLTFRVKNVATPISLHNTAKLLDEVHHDLIIIWSITLSIQGVKSPNALANALMDSCYHNANLSIEQIDTECKNLLNSIPSNLIAPESNETPRSEIVACHLRKYLSFTCQLTASRRTLLYLTYVWALTSFASEHQLPSDSKGKQNLLKLITHSLEGHGLTVKNDPRIPHTLLCLSKRQRMYDAQPVG